MPRYLITVSLGPVQSLIESARRTRDLWCGSWLLAEAAKATALVLHVAQLGSPIFPCPDNPDDELAPSDAPKERDANIANVLRAVLDLPDEQSVRELLARAQQAAHARLATLCEQARGKLPGLPFHEDLWRMQKNDIVESFAAWVEIQNRPDGYSVAAERLGELLAARKATRMFVPAATISGNLATGYGIPKSSLDGAREAVVNVAHADREKGPHKNALRRLGMGRGEELDALAVAKRMAGDVEQFTAFSRIAADTWIEDLKVNNPKALAAIVQSYEPLVGAGLATRIKGNTENNTSIYAALPYDAQLVFDFRLANARVAADASEKPLLEALRIALEGAGQAVPYAVVLKADGDRMGELLGKATCVEQSRAISKALHGFAVSVRGIVRAHRGHAIYAGGDDVLALLPLDGALACAAALAEAFRQAMSEMADALGVDEGKRPTLSVGLGIGHILEPLGSLRARANAAERHAKGNDQATPRNALAIKLGVRSGTDVLWRCRWNDDVGASKDCAGIYAMQQFIKAYQGENCPSRLAFDLHAIARRLAWAKDEAGIHASELSRTLDRARLRGGDGKLSDTLKEFIELRESEVGLASLADELIIARWLSARTASDIGDTK